MNEPGNDYVAIIDNDGNIIPIAGYFIAEEGLNYDFPLEYLREMVEYEQIEIGRAV